MAMGAPVKMRRRSLIAAAVIIVLGFGLLAVRLGYLQFVDGEELQHSAVNQQLRDTTILPERGTIYDRNGTALAESATVWTVYIAPKYLVVNGNEEKTNANRAKLADGLSEILGVDREEIYKKTEQTSNYHVIIKRRIETDIKDQILEFEKTSGLSGAAIGLDEDTKRYYPFGDFASTVIGFTGTDNQGLEGIEAYYDSYLQGTPGRLMTARNAVGTDMPFEYEQRVDAVDGNDLVLTIDKSLQYYLEKHLDQALEDNKIETYAMGIIIDVNTFEVLAMATRPGYDLNNPWALPEETLQEIELLPEEEQADARYAAQSGRWKNRTINEAYEPGSVFKIVTASAALDEGAIDSGSIFDCTGVYSVASQKYRCNNWAVHGTQTVAQCLQNSCNIGFIQIGQRLGVEAFCRYYRAFGFTERTGIDLPGETRPEAGIQYHAEQNMGVVELASSSFGQSQRVTALQMVTAMATAVNGGKLGTPHVVRQILDEDGNIVKSVDSTIKRQVISEETSQLMRQYLELVVSEGGGKNAAVSGYRVGGKTGTAEKLDAEDKSARIASFCGFGPVEDPQIACIIVVDEPKGGTVYGSTVAAPIFKAIMEEALPYLGAEKSEESGEDAQKTITAPKVIDETLEKAKTDIKNAGFNIRIMGSGDTVLAQLPSPGTQLKSGATLVVYTDEESKEKTVKVPDFTGMTASQVNTTAALYGVNVQMSGVTSGTRSVAVKQSYEEDTLVSPGTIVTVEFLVNNDPQ